MGFLQRAVTKAGMALPLTTRETLLLRTFGLVKIPLLLFCTPSVVVFDAKVCTIRIPLNWRTRNHLGSMYFGALAVGADCAGGYAAMYHVRQSGRKIALIFKDFKAEFLKRPMSDVLFRSEDGELMADLVRRAVSSGERVDATVNVVATSPQASGDEPVAKFALTVSVKLKE